MLTIWRRHNPDKCNLTKRSETKCRCIIWATGTLPNGRKVRESTKLRDWTRATAVIRQWEVEGEPPKIGERITLAGWKEAFLEDAKSRNLASETYRKYVLLFKQLGVFATNKGLRYVDQLDLSVLTAFRSTWKDEALSSSKKLERLRSVLKFALRCKWVKENAADELDSPKLKPSPKLPFPADEYARILEAALIAPDARTHTFIQTMRHSGLRISDTTTLAVNSLHGNKLQLYQAKTGEPVSVPIPEQVATALRAVRRRNPQYFFWSAHSKVQAAASVWRKRMSAVFEVAKITDGHTHRFRDTFAVALLEKGVSLETVSILLGHQSLKNHSETLFAVG